MSTSAKGGWVASGGGGGEASCSATFLPLRGVKRPPAVPCRAVPCRGAAPLARVPEVGMAAGGSWDQGERGPLPAAPAAARWDLQESGGFSSALPTLS